MTEATGDRRARRSRKLLKQGLLELLREKCFSRISVRDITERMDLNRGTFYLHYPDTTALMRSVESDLLGEIQALVDSHMGETVEGRSLRPVFEPVLDYVVAHRETCAALFNSDSASGFLEQLQKLVYQNGRPLLGQWYAADSRPEAEEPAGPVTPGADEIQAALSFVAFGLVGLVKTWFDGNMALPREDLLRTADALALGAAAGLRNSETGGPAVGGPAVSSPATDGRLGGDGPAVEGPAGSADGGTANPTGSAGGEGGRSQ